LRDLHHNIPSRDTRLIGDMSVSAIGLGSASWTLTGRPDAEGVKAVHAALDAGITLIDTARAYTTPSHPGLGETLVRRALAEHRAGSSVVVATKGGHYRNGDDFPIDARPEALRRDCALSRGLLGIDRIDLYFLHHPDPRVPVRSSIAALAGLQEAGWIRHIGVSNVSPAQLEEALSVAPIAAVQNRFSPLEQTDRPVVDICAKTGVAYLAYSPLGGRASALAEAFPAAADLAARKGVSMARLALAWLLTVSPTLIPITGASRPESIRDSALAADLQLTEDELSRLDFGSR
jgi:aryl-alcohol dehydrogenase-like predicted oxidoreductase